MVWPTLLCLFFSFPLFAQFKLDEVLVSSKNDQVISNLNADITIIDSKKIEASKEQNVVDLLKKTGGFDISQSGARGSQASFYYRGLEMRHMLVMIDGVKVSDPSNSDRHFDFSKLDLSDVEKIEIIKGAGSVLYGSEAIAGVLNIITKKAQKDEVKLTLKEGIQKSLWLKASKVNESNRFNLQTSLSEANYQSSAKEGEEYDKYQNQNYSAFYEHFINDNFFLSFFSKIQKSRTEFDGLDFPSGLPVDNLENINFDLDQIYSQSLEYNINDSSKLKTKISHHRIDRKTEGESATLYTGISDQADFSYLYKIGKSDLIFGFDTEKEFIKGSEVKEADATLASVYTKYSQNGKKIFWDLGLRGANHSQFSSLLVGGAGVGFKIDPEKTLRLNYTTGFKQPSLYQLYAPNFGSFIVGNSDLSPERSKNVDLSFEIKKEKISHKISLFYYEVTSLIDFGPSGYENLNELRTKGLEYSLVHQKKRLTSELVLNFLDLSDIDGESPLRRAREKVHLNFFYSLAQAHEFAFQNRWTGSREDLQGGERVKLSPYSVSDLTYSFHFKKSSLSLGIHNLFDSHYELLKGYSVERRNIQVEFSQTF